MSAQTTTTLPLAVKKKNHPASPQVGFLFCLFFCLINKKTHAASPQG
jgi:hypothetical protein